MVLGVLFELGLTSSGHIASGVLTLWPALSPTKHCQGQTLLCLVKSQGKTSSVSPLKMSPLSHRCSLKFQGAVAQNSRPGLRLFHLPGSHYHVFSHGQLFLLAQARHATARALMAGACCSEVMYMMTPTQENSALAWPRPTGTKTDSWEMLYCGWAKSSTWRLPTGAGFYPCTVCRLFNVATALGGF